MRIVLPQSTTYNTITVQVILKSIRDLQSYRSLNIQNIARVEFKQRSFIMLQEKIIFKNVRNNLICQPLVCTSFGLKKQGFSLT